MLADLSNSGATPALEAVIRFSGQRQRLIAHNIANLSTPGFIPLDVSVGGFQKALDEAIQRRREQTGGMSGPLAISETNEIKPDGRGGFSLEPTTPGQGVLFHDQSMRDPERLMQALAENTSEFRVATELLRSQRDMLRSAISQRV